MDLASPPYDLKVVLFSRHNACNMDCFSWRYGVKTGRTDSTCLGLPWLLNVVFDRLIEFAADIRGRSGIFGKGRKSLSHIDLILVDFGEEKQTIERYCFDFGTP